MTNWDLDNILRLTSTTLYHMIKFSIHLSFTVHYNYTKIGRFTPILSITICFKLFVLSFCSFLILKCFQNHCQFLKSQKQAKAFFKVSQRFFLVLNWTTNSWRGIKTSFARDNEKARNSGEYGPENGKQKFNQTRRRSHNTRIYISRYLPYLNRDVKLSVLSIGNFISFSLEQMIWKFEKICYR